MHERPMAQARTSFLYYYFVCPKPSACSFRGCHLRKCFEKGRSEQVGNTAVGQISLGLQRWRALKRSKGEGAMGEGDQHMNQGALLSFLEVCLLCRLKMAFAKDILQQATVKWRAVEKWSRIKGVWFFVLGLGRKKLSDKVLAWDMRGLGTEEPGHQETTELVSKQWNSNPQTLSRALVLMLWKPNRQSFCGDKLCVQNFYLLCS